MEKGFAGRIAEFFINSKLTILLMIALMIISCMVTPPLQQALQRHLRLDNQSDKIYC